MKLPLIQLPIGVEDDFRGIIDVIKLKAYEYQDDLGEKLIIRDLEQLEQEQANKYRTLLLEKLAEYDDRIWKSIWKGRKFPLMKSSVL